MASSRRVVPDARRVAGVLRLVEADPHMGLRGEVVDLVGLDLLQQRHEP